MIFHSTSKKPILIVGNGVHSAGAEKILLEFAEKTNIPVLTTMNAVDLIQADDKLGFIGVYGNRVANMIVNASDLVISIGARLGLRQIGNIKEYFAPNAKLIRVDIDEYELSRTIKEDEEKYLEDAKEFLTRLMAEDISDYSEWKNKCYEAKSILSEYDREPGNLCMEKISELLPEDAKVAVDVGQTLCWAAQSLTLKGKDGRLFIGGSYGSMGCGLPMAIGASIAENKKIVFCVTGDGGLQMNIQELQAVVTEKLPIKILVINNHVLGKISEIQEKSYGSRFAQTTEGSGYGVPDFVKVAEAYGIKAANANEYQELDNYREWFTDDDACLISIEIPNDSKLIPKVNWNSNKILPAIDDVVEQNIERILGGNVK